MKKIKAYMDKNNIICPCFSVYIELAGYEQSEQIEELKAYADVAKILGSPYLHHTIASECQFPEKIVPIREEKFNKGIKAVRQIYDYAESIGIKTIYEDQGYCFNGVEWFSKFLNEVERDVGVVADFGNIYESKNDIVDFVKAFSERICHVHFKDVLINDENTDGTGLFTLNGRIMHDGVEFGTGSVDFEGGMKVLKEAGYDGYYSIEYGVSRDEDEVKIENAVNFVKEIVNKWK